MVAGIRHVEIAMRIQINAPGIAETAGSASRKAEDLHCSVLCIENLNPAVPEFTNKLVTGRIHAHVIRIAQFSWSMSRASITAQPSAFWGKDLDAVVARVRHIKPTGRIEAQAFGAIELAITDAFVADDFQQ